MKNLHPLYGRYIQLSQELFPGACYLGKVLLPSEQSKCVTVIANLSDRFFHLQQVRAGRRFCNTGSVELGSYSTDVLSVRMNSFWSYLALLAFLSVF